MSDQRSADFLAVVIENAELRQQLADVQDQCVELAVDAGELHPRGFKSPRPCSRLRQISGIDSRKQEIRFYDFMVHGRCQDRPVCALIEW